MRIGSAEMIIILIVAVVLFVVFGPKNLPKLGKMFGSTMKEVRKGMNEATEAMQDETPAPAAPASAPAAPAAPAPAAPADDAAEPKIDPDRKVAKIIYEDEE